MQLGRLQAERHERIIKEIEFLKHKAEDATCLEAEVASIEAEKANIEARVASIEAKNARLEAELERITKKFLPTIVIVFKVSELYV